MALGRHSKCTPEVTDKIITALRAGNYIETAAAYAGICRAALYEWLRLGARGGSEVHEKFAADVEEALAFSEVRDVAVIAKASTEQWQAAAWRLERRHPDKWGRRERVAISNDPDPESPDTGTGLMEKLRKLADPVSE